MTVMKWNRLMDGSWQMAGKMFWEKHVLFSLFFFYFHVERVVISDVSINLCVQEQNG